MYAKCHALIVLLAVSFATGYPAAGFAAETPVFHLDFSKFSDVSGNSLPIDAGEAVSLIPGGGPTLEDGRTLHAGEWEGVDDDTNQIIILDNEVLDAVAVGAGSIAVWIKPDDGDEWNNIVKTPCEDHLEPCDAFGQFIGIEFQSSGPHAGVFGAVQGWETNVFGPDTPLGPGGETDTPSDEWTHAALTWNADGDHTIFVNGVAGETVFGVGDFDFGDNTPDNWTIGGDGLGTNPETTDDLRYLRGQLADFAIYDSELTADDVSEIMRSGVASAAPGDFDGSGSLDIADLNLLSAAIASQANESSFDVNADAEVDSKDLSAWVKDLKKSWIGDSNLDGEFNSGDLVEVFTSGEYEDDVEDNSTWSTGDWDANGEFTSGDIVAAFTDGGYERGPQPALNAVPEPASFLMVMTSLIGIGICRRRFAGVPR